MPVFNSNDSRGRNKGRRGRRNASLLRVLSRPGDARRNLEQQTVVKNSCTSWLGRPGVSAGGRYLLEAGAPLTTIYREPRRCVINSSAHARNFKTFQASLFFHFQERPLPPGRSPARAAPPVPRRGTQRAGPRVGVLLRGFARVTYIRLTPRHPCR